MYSVNFIFVQGDQTNNDLTLLTVLHVTLQYAWTVDVIMYSSDHLHPFPPPSLFNSLSV